MTNAEQERGGSSGLLRWALFGAIALVVLLALFLITLVGFGYADTVAYFLGYRETSEFSAGGRFTRDLLLALSALVSGTAIMAWRIWVMSRQADAALNQSRASEKQADAALEKNKNESNQIAGEQFSDAVKMLAQNEGSKPAITTRVGGVQALRLLANKYASEYAAQVVKTLVAYVRENVQLTKIPRKDSNMNFLGEDVKAAFAVLAQLLDERSESPEKKFELSDNDLDFSECDFSRLCLNDRQVNGLRHYRWQEADLQGSDLRRSDLRGSDLRGANFKEARMHGAQLQGVNLRGANLKGARLHNADLRGASLGMRSAEKTFERVNLQGASLYGTDLRGAVFSATNPDYPLSAAVSADLTCVDLNYAKLQDTDLREANLSDVKNWPQLSPDQIWHSGQRGLERVESIKMSPGRVWDLKPYRDCPYALAGVLRNYTTMYAYGFRVIHSRGLLKAARKLLDDNQLPKEFPENWRKWLEGVDPKTGIHLDWEKQNPISQIWQASE